jgi:hypothetical protein
MTFVNNFLKTSFNNICQQNPLTTSVNNICLYTFVNTICQHLSTFFNNIISPTTSFNNICQQNHTAIFVNNICQQCLSPNICQQHLSITFITFFNKIIWSMRSLSTSFVSNICLSMTFVNNTLKNIIQQHLSTKPLNNFCQQDLSLYICQQNLSTTSVINIWNNIFQQYYSVNNIFQQHLSTNSYIIL